MAQWQSREGGLHEYASKVDLRKTLVPFIEILGHLQNIEYEELHIICLECGGYGHRKDNRPKLIKLSEQQTNGGVGAQVVGLEGQVGMGPSTNTPSSMMKEGV